MKSSMLSNIFKYVQLSLVAVAVVEQTLQQDSSASKQQKAIDLATNESQVAGLFVPGISAIAPSIVNMVVAGFNLAGLFSHKPAVAGVA